MRGLLQGAEGGRSYVEYMNLFRRDAEKIDKVKAQIGVVEQLVTLFMLTTTASNNPVYTRCMGELQVSEEGVTRYGKY